MYLFYSYDYIHVSILFCCIHPLICIWCLVRSLDLTHFWCLGPDHDPVDDALYEVPVVGDYWWGPADQVVEPEDGAPIQGERTQFFLLDFESFI